MRVIFSLIFTIFLSHFAQASAKDLRIGECLADPQTKRYVRGNFQSPYPREVAFSCSYTCLSKKGEETFRGMREVTINNRTDEAKKAVCQGVIVKKVSWGYEFEEALPFYAFDTQIPAIKSWAFKNLDFSSPIEKEYLKKLKKHLLQTAKSYQQASGDSPLIISMRKASRTLEKIARSLPENTKKLEKYTEMIRQRNGAYPPHSNPHFWIFSALKTQASWRLPLSKNHATWEAL